jgi:adenylosuccinate synthase
MFSESDAVNNLEELTLGDMRRGSCSLGFGATIVRENDGVHLSLRDILDVNFADKLAQIKRYYKLKINFDTGFNFGTFDHDREDRLFFDAVDSLQKLIKKKIVTPVYERDVFNGSYGEWNTIIFEGAQGILFDQTFGNKPNITKSNTTAQNAFIILRRNHIRVTPEIYYVTRAYQTRHGAGNFREEHPLFSLIAAETETNVYNDYQGELRRNFIDVDALNYSLKCDSNFSEISLKNLVITCLDQLETNFIHYYQDGNLKKIFYEDFHLLLNAGFNSVLYSFGRSSNSVTKGFQAGQETD